RHGGCARARPRVRAPPGARGRCGPWRERDRGWAGLSSVGESIFSGCKNRGEGCVTGRKTVSWFRHNLSPCHGLYALILMFPRSPAERPDRPFPFSGVLHVLNPRSRRKYSHGGAHPVAAEPTREAVRE